ncbi:unnamed protein product [Enterobius vermicularis]|uniref:Cyclin-dependent kinases regulatory subunit n=1 Tax=Enterobius vermicularis TaxID=51028 RepID=A0A0N4VNK3_ENTVE|nr:unnamed protein product [Enterobius vermicularis]
MSAVGTNGFIYSEKYCDDQYEYRHVHITPEVAKLISRQHLLSESEWRHLGVEQSRGWEHYMYHSPEKHDRQEVAAAKHNICQMVSEVVAAVKLNKLFCRFFCSEGL